MNLPKVRIFDTTLRDGGQCRGKPLSPAEKLNVARQLALLQVDVIEAGFPAAVSEDFEALQLISEDIKGCTLAGLARAREEDIEQMARALEKAESPRIHIFVSVPKIKGTQPVAAHGEEAIASAIHALKFARKHFSDIEFSPHNATRLDEKFLVELSEAAIGAGATTLNISDTVGYSIPSEFGKLIQSLREQVSNIEQAVLSVHCHNDLGLAVANSLAAIQAGARQVECAVNGNGERAGNAALEEIVVALEARKDIFGVECGIDTTRIAQTSYMIQEITGYPVHRNKPIVGASALNFDPEIQETGFAKSDSYEMIKPEQIGSQYKPS